MENLYIYESARTVPEGAKKKIGAGRLSGMTDINPMWRIKKLTELFGPCGIGWKIDNVEKSVLDGNDGVKVAVVDIDLFIKNGEQWSEPIHGTGGSTLVAKEKNGLYTSDEAFKMAYTDAISVSCKLLGFGADVYWDADRQTKYDKKPESKPQEGVILCDRCGHAIVPKSLNGTIYSPEQQAEGTKAKYGHALCWTCAKELAEAKKLAETLDEDMT